MPSASQFIEIKRLQTGINGRIANTKPKRGADTYDGYAGSGILTLPPNVLLSNKFIVPEESGGGGGGNCDLIEINFGKGTAYNDPCTNFVYQTNERVAMIGYTEDTSLLTTLDIPDTVTSIGQSAFSGCINLESLTLPNSLVSIGNGAFANCHSLTSITIPTSVTSIANNCFTECYTLSSLNILSISITIGDLAFKLTPDITGPASVLTPEGINDLSGLNLAGDFDSQLRVFGKLLS